MQKFFFNFANFFVLFFIFILAHNVAEARYVALNSKQDICEGVQQGKMIFHYRSGIALQELPNRYEKLFFPPHLTRLIMTTSIGPGSGRVKTALRYGQPPYNYPAGYEDYTGTIPRHDPISSIEQMSKNDQVIRIGGTENQTGSMFNITNQDRLQGNLDGDWLYINNFSERERILTIRYTIGVDQEKTAAWCAEEFEKDKETIEVNISPDGAIQAGAKWRISDQDQEQDQGWIESGELVELDPGAYTLEFKELDGWWEQENITVNLEAGGQPVIIDAEYRKIEPGFTLTAQEARDRPGRDISRAVHESLVNPEIRLLEKTGQTYNLQELVQKILDKKNWESQVTLLDTGKEQDKGHDLLIKVKYPNYGYVYYPVRIKKVSTTDQEDSIAFSDLAEQIYIINGLKMDMDTVPVSWYQSQDGYQDLTQGSLGGLLLPITEKFWCHYLANFSELKDIAFDELLRPTSLENENSINERLIVRPAYAESECLPVHSNLCLSLDNEDLVQVFTPHLHESEAFAEWLEEGDVKYRVDPHSGYWHLSFDDYCPIGVPSFYLNTADDIDEGLAIRAVFPDDLAIVSEDGSQLLHMWWYRCN